MYRREGDVLGVTTGVGVGIGFRAVSWNAVKTPTASAKKARMIISQKNDDEAFLRDIGYSSNGVSLQWVTAVCFIKAKSV